MPDNQTSGNKSRILFLLRYLQENTDDEHVISTNELISLFAQHGFKANRDTIRDDVSMLNEVQFNNRMIRRFPEHSWYENSLYIGR